MKKRVDLHHGFLVVSVVLIFFLLVFHDLQTQIMILACGVFLYLLMSLLHHHFDRSLTKETTLEYIAVAGLVLILLTGLLNF